MIEGFVHPESAAYDPKRKVLYVGQFGSVLKPTLKDGKGRISKVSLSGEMLEAQFLPTRGRTLNKPKGIWVSGDRLWVTDIDAVWVFDLRTREGRKAVLPGARFANDPVVIQDALYVSDTGAGRIYRVTPADFLGAGDPEVTLFSSGLDFGPNGLCPDRDGFLFVVGYTMGPKGGGIYRVDPLGNRAPLSGELGRLDGVAQMGDRTLLVTDWGSGSLLRWSMEKGAQTLVGGFRGPADFCVVPRKTGLMAVVPDLVTGRVGLIGLVK
jgi:sugar lactone lactonase YvrE